MPTTTKHWSYRHRGNYSGAIDSGGNYNKELAVDKQLGLKPDPDALSNKKLAVEALFATARLR